MGTIKSYRYSIFLQSYSKELIIRESAYLHVTKCFDNSYLLDPAEAPKYNITSTLTYSCLVSGINKSLQYIVFTIINSIYNCEYYSLLQHPGKERGGEGGNTI